VHQGQEALSRNQEENLKTKAKESCLTDLVCSH
jgi:hypothetical protein